MIPAMSKIHTAQSHTAWDPLFHLVLMPIFLANLIIMIARALREWQDHPGRHLWAIVVAFALLALCGKVRIYALANQDRTIRLEERLRIAALAPSADIYALSTRQLIALRFASDAELPALVQRTTVEKLGPKAIKASIITWRQDLSRI